MSACCGVSAGQAFDPDHLALPAQAGGASRKESDFQINAVPLCVRGAVLTEALAAVPSPPQDPSAPPRSQSAQPHDGVTDVIAILPPAMSRKRLSARDKFQVYLHQGFGPQNFILPAFGAGYYMLEPPSHYPRDWKDGGGAFGRWYAEQFVASTSNRTGQLLAEVALHEDPRYLPSKGKNVLMRTFHAVGFTFVDKTDSEHDTVAISNFAGAVAGAFVGMGLLPNGYNSARHAEQRALRGLATDAVRNILTEFRPEWSPVLRRIRIPRVLPEWWTGKRSENP